MRRERLTVAEVIGWSAKNGWHIGWFSPKAPATSVKIGQAARLRFVKRASLEPFRFEAVFNISG
jgi:hypothetical protein